MRGTWGTWGTRVAVVAVAVVAAGGGHGRAAPAQTRRYVQTPVDGLTLSCSRTNGRVDGTGRGCFNVEPGATAVSATITDDVVPGPIAGHVVFFGPDSGIKVEYPYLVKVPFCGSVADVAVPAGAIHFDVAVGDRGVDAPACAERTVGTAGTITVTQS